MSSHQDTVRAADVEPAAVATDRTHGDSGDMKKTALVEETSNGNGEALTDGGESGARTSKRKQWFAYIKTRQFWIVLVAG